MSINPLKLQKLLYYIQVWHIVNFKKDYLFSELPEAWVNGPVYRSVYDTLKTKFFKNQNYVYKYEGEKLNEELSSSLKELELTPKQEKLVFAVLDNYGPMSDEKLVFLTHKEDPWNKAREGLSPIERSARKISVDDIFTFYTSRLKK